MAKSRRTKVSRPSRKNGSPAAGAPARLPEAGGDTSSDASAEYPFPVAAIGGSAGSLAPLLEILGHLPENLGMAVVVIQHQARDLPSGLRALAGGRCALPVREISQGMRVEPGIVYVAPPDAELHMADGAFRLGKLPGKEHLPTRIDQFFGSLAAEAGASAVGVVLSGMGADGTVGLREIKETGGITLAQDPGTAHADSMPRAAIHARVVNKVAAPGEIAEALIHISGHPPGRDGAGAWAPEEVRLEDPMARIFALLRLASGVDFTHYKQPTIRRRLHRRMVLHKIASLDAYLKYLQENPGEVKGLYEDILIHVTSFFRDPESFGLLAEKVLPAIADRRHPHMPIRVWVPGCSTGEEPYSIAMLLLEYLGEHGLPVPVQIFATDVSDGAVDQARAGVYPESIVANVSPERLRRFFRKVDGQYQVGQMVRDCCVFARQDLTRDPPFSKLDLIVCRNVLIYLGPVLQKRLMNVFHYALRPTGFLLLGGTESVGLQVDLFRIVDKRHKLYTKRVAEPLVDMHQPALAPPPPPGQRLVPGPRPAADVRSASTIQNEANRIILAKYSPPGVIVDGELRITQFRGQTGMFLEPAPGEASLNVLKMAREGLLYGLRNALHEARKTNAEAVREGLRVKLAPGAMTVNVSVTPLGANTPEGLHFLILFDKAQPLAEGKAEGRGKRAGARRGAEDDRMLRLQQELAASREYLQSIIQDLEAANEELQSANEEILSSNEELQSTNEELDTAKEELQSTNEELNTVNEELHGRNDELMQVNSDLVNLLASVQIAIVMVATDLRIRRFTPMAEKVLNLIPTDVGRPISDIKPNIDCPDLERMITDSIDSVTIKETVVHDRQGKTFNLRVRPYKNVENRIDGAVLVLFETEGSRPPEGRP